MKEQKKADKLYSLIPLDDFKALMGVDDREDKLCRFCLVTATLSIEQYCMRKFLRKKKTEVVDLSRGLIVPLSEFPVIEVLAVYGINSRQEMFIEPFFYRVMVGCAFNEDLPFELLLSASLKPYQFTAVKVIYWSGYVPNPHPCGFETRSFCDAKTPTLKTTASVPSIPADLASACLELAAWNMNRYGGRRVGLMGSVRKDGEQFELSMPENVRVLLEPYRRKTI
ncbi:MAG: hypothetical protein LBC80_00455 [Treponema sp.]|jgi:hypothetical protein|nr:hypothetical protein [Treponema sp.]